MIVALLVLGAVGLVAIGLLFAKAKDLHDWGYSWGYSFSQVLRGF